MEIYTYSSCARPNQSESNHGKFNICFCWGIPGRVHLIYRYITFQEYIFLSCVLDYICYLVDKNYFKYFEYSNITIWYPFIENRLIKITKPEKNIPNITVFFVMVRPLLQMQHTKTRDKTSSSSSSAV